MNASNIDLEVRVIDVITRVEQAYWDLVAARQAVAVTEDNVNLGREQLAINNRLVKAGTLAPVELAAAEAELQRRMDTWYTNLGALTEVENNLKTLIAPERSASIWNDEIIPAETRTVDEPQADDLRDAVQVALKRRPELRGSRHPPRDQRRAEGSERGPAEARGQLHRSILRWRSGRTLSTTRILSPRPARHRSND